VRDRSSLPQSVFGRPNEHRAALNSRQAPPFASEYIIRRKRVSRALGAALYVSRGSHHTKFRGSGSSRDRYRARPRDQYPKQFNLAR